MKIFLFAFLMSCLTAATGLAQTGPAHGAGDASSAVKVPVLPQSNTIDVSYLGKVTKVTMEDLRKLPQTTLNVHNASKNIDESYTGPLLANVLGLAGLKASVDTEWAMLHSSLIATGKFNYFVVYSVPEVEPSYSTRQIIVAISKSGQPNTEGGVIELVNTLDSNPIRWVHGLTDLTVIRQTPVK
jgi:hypothetical protein